MLQNILRHLGGIDHYGMFTLCLFAAIFAAVFTWACLQSQAHLDRMARVPLETETDPEATQPGELSHE